MRETHTEGTVGMGTRGGPVLAAAAGACAMAGASATLGHDAMRAEVLAAAAAYMGGCALHVMARTTAPRQAGRDAAAGCFLAALGMAAAGTCAAILRGAWAEAALGAALAVSSCLALVAHPLTGKARV